jgi:hypothetical protein
MPESSTPGDEPEIRPQVVQAVFSALMDMDPAKLAPLEAMKITAAEREHAEDLFAAALLANHDQRGRWLKSIEVLLGDRTFTTPPTWAELFDGLTPERAAQLRDLYDAMPDSARAEYDRRYGRPEAI